jgi:LysM repeat protein
MRTFFILVLFFAAFIVVVLNLIVGVDLTPNTPNVAQAAAPSAVPTTSSPQEITIQESPATIYQSIVLVPVTGCCANPYTVKSGDSLSQIAVNCNTTLVAIRQANMQIINANLIYPGQQVNIPNGNIVQIPVTGKEEATPVATLPQTCACSSAPVPVTGLIPMLIPGSSLQVRAINFQPNTPVDVAIGPENTAYTVVTRGVTDADGNLTTSITVPTGSTSQTLWVVVVSTTTQPPVQAKSRTFPINP